MMEAEEETPRSIGPLVCGILGLLFQGLFLLLIRTVLLEDFRSNSFWLIIGLGVLSLGLSIFPLVSGRAGIAAKVVGVIGVIGWVLLAFFVLYCIICIARGMGWYGNQ